MPKQYAIKLEMTAKATDFNAPLDAFVECLEAWKIPKGQITDYNKQHVWTDRDRVFRWDPCKINDDYFVDFVIREPDNRIQGRYWTSQVSAYIRNEKITASIEISTIDLNDDAKAPSGNRPKIINIFADRFECRIGLGILTRRSKEVSRDDAADFVRFSIRDLYRSDPILVVYPYSEGKYPLSETEWVNEFQGFGTLFHASSVSSAQSISRFLSEHERPQLGGIQIWWPHINGKITVTTLPPENAENRFERLKLATELSLRMADLFHEPKIFSLFRDKRSIYLSQERERSHKEFEEALKKAQNSGEANEIIELYSKENAELKEQISELEDELRRERSKIEFFQQRIQFLQSSTSSKITPSRSPETTYESVQIASSEFDSLLFLPAAFSSSENNNYRNPVEVLDALRVLNQAAATSIANKNKLGDSLKNWLKLRGFDYGEGISDMTSKEDRKQHEFVYQDNLFFCEQHLKLGSGKHSERDCLRVYFSSTPFEKKWVVGHVGEHFDCIST